MLHFGITSALCSLAAFSAAAAEYANPIVSGDWSDPGLIRVGPDYYSVRSTFGWQPALSILHSRDLVHWRHIGHGLRTHPAIAPGTTRGGVWGADIGWNPNTRRFVIYAPLDNRLYAMSAAQPGGPYSAPVELGLRGIDPGFFADTDNRLYLVWDWGRIVELTPDAMAVKREVGSLGLGRGRNFEGPSLLKRGGWYFCVYSTGGTRPYQESAIRTARARRLEGPWEEDPDNPQLQATADTRAAFQGPAHGTLVETTNGQWYVAYHAYQLSHYSLGRSMLLEPVRWTENGWWRPVNGRIPSLRASAPALSEVPYRLIANDDFAGRRLGLQWFFHLPPDRASYSLAARPGWLRATPTSEPLSTTFLQSVREKAFEFETLLDFQPRAEADCAGLLVYHDPAAYFTLARARRDAAAVVEVRKHFEGNHRVVACASAPGHGMLRLKVRIDGSERATFLWSTGGTLWRELAGEIYFGHEGDPDLGWTGKDKRNTWTGTAFGVFVQGKTPVDFGWFRVGPRGK